MAIDIASPGASENALEAALRERTLDGLAIIEDITTNKTLAGTDTGKIFLYTGDTNINLTVPGTLVRGFSVGIIVKGDGDVVVVPATGATTIDTDLSIFGNGSLLVYQNTDNASAVFQLRGDVQ